MGGPRVGGTTGEAAGSGSLLGHHHSPCEATACLFDGGLLVLSAFIPPVDPRHHRRVTFVSQAVLGPLLFVVILWLLRSPTSEPGDDDDGASAATLTSLGVALAVIGCFGGLLAIAVVHRTRLSERDRTLPPLPKTLVSVWSLLLSATVAYLFAAWAVEGLAGFASLASLPLADPKATRNAMKDDDDDDDDDDTRTNGAAGGVAPFLAGLFLPSLFVMALPTIDDAAAVYLSRVSPSHPTRIQVRWSKSESYLLPADAPFFLHFFHYLVSCHFFYFHGLLLSFLLALHTAARDGCISVAWCFTTADRNCDRSSATSG